MSKSLNNNEIEEYLQAYSLNGNIDKNEVYTTNVYKNPLLETDEAVDTKKSKNKINKIQKCCKILEYNEYLESFSL